MLAQQAGTSSRLESDGDGLVKPSILTAVYARGGVMSLRVDRREAEWVIVREAGKCIGVQGDSDEGSRE